MSERDTEALLREVGRRLSERFSEGGPADDPDARREQVEAVLDEMGGVSTTERTEGDALVVRGTRCPFAAVVPDHPAVCAMTESFLAHLTGRSVQQKCEPDGAAPQCRFVVGDGPASDGTG